MRKILALLYLLLVPALVALADRKFTLVIDAGHGGHDAGAVGTFSKEKTINLRTALAFGKYVETYCPDVNVIYTRKTDVFVPLHTRAEIANKAKADLFISIHTNSLEKKNVGRGLETYTLGMHRAAENLDVAKRENAVILVEKDYKQRYEGFDPNSAESYIIFEFMQDHNMARSVEFAKGVQKNVCSTAKRPDKGVKQAGFLVLRETSMPSCLIELGYISTLEEERLLNEEGTVNNMALGIYQAFAAYKKKYDHSASALTPPTVMPEPQPALVQETDKPRQSQSKSTRAQADDTPGKSAKAQAADTPVKSTRAQVADPQPDKTVKGGPDPLPEQDAKPDKEQPAQQSSAPVFKVQIFVTDRVLKAGDSNFKGEKDYSYYKEGKAYKYTIGESTNYSEVYQTRKRLLEKFPEAFIIAFKDGVKMPVNDAIKEYKANKNK